MKHETRLRGLILLAMLCIVGEVILMLVGRFGHAESIALGGALAVLLPAVVDASSVDKARRDPSRRALPDDVVDADRPADRPTPKP